jgi:probable selenium-dependent hydroxylase accessory protein YqeC
LGITRGDVVAFVGAGGKSGSIIQATSELKDAGVPVLVAPTTKMFVSEAEVVGPILTSENGHGLRTEVTRALACGGAVVAGSAILSKKRVGGVEPTLVPHLAPQDGVTLVEADGARRRPLKGTAAHEPLLPEGATLVVAVGGIRALGEPMDEEYVHRPEVFSELTGTRPGQTIDARAFAGALLAGFHNAPEGVRRAVLLTDVEPGRSMARASVVARGLWRGGVRNVALCSIPYETPGRVWVV